MSSKRDDLLLIANAEAASLFVGKKKISEALVKKAQNAAFEAIRRHDRLAGTSHHAFLRSSGEIAALANEGVAQARASSERIARDGVRINGTRISSLSPRQLQRDIDAALGKK